MSTRRGFIKSICRTLAVFSFDQVISGLPLGVSFVNIAREAGLKAKTIYRRRAKE